MIKKNTLLIVNCIFLLFFIKLKAQVLDTDQVSIDVSVPEIALIDIEPSNEQITFNIAAVSNAGEKIDVSSLTNNTKWINYTSSLAPTSSSRNVSAQIISGNVPSGMELKLIAGSYTGTGAGTHGTSSGVITLSTSSQNIITNIGGAYTDNGSSNGHQLTYSLNIINYSLLDFEDTDTLIITFTLIDN